MTKLRDLNVGDRVTRLLAGKVPMDLKVTEVRPDRIVCGWWEFDPETGAEIDDDLNWGPPPKFTGSYIQTELVEGSPLFGLDGEA